MIKLKSGSGPTIRSYQKSDVAADLSYTLSSTYVSGGTYVSQTIGDSVYSVYEASVYNFTGNLLISGMGSYEVTNFTPSIATIDSDLKITRNSPGILNLVVKNKLISIPMSIDLSDNQTPIAQPKVYQHVVAGSLADHCRQAIDTRIVGKNMSTNGSLYSTQNHAGVNLAPTYVRNPLVWCHDINLTCASPWNTNAGIYKAGVLITPRHVLTCAHYEIDVGTNLRFVTQDNQWLIRRVISKVRHPNYLPYAPDFTVYTLGSDVPASITPTEVLPANYKTKLVNIVDNAIPVLCLDQEEKALVVEWYKDGILKTPWFQSQRYIFNEDKITGDSGNPVFLIINNKPVLLTLLTYGVAGAGTLISDYISDINSMIVSADTQVDVSSVSNNMWPNANGHYTLKEADLSMFPTY